MSEWINELSRDLFKVRSKVYTLTQGASLNPWLFRLNCGSGECHWDTLVRFAYIFPKWPLSSFHRYSSNTMVTGHGQNTVLDFPLIYTTGWMVAWILATHSHIHISLFLYMAWLPGIEPQVVGPQHFAFGCLTSPRTEIRIPKSKIRGVFSTPTPRRICHRFVRGKLNEMFGFPVWLVEVLFACEPRSPHRRLWQEYWNT